MATDVEEAAGVQRAAQGALVASLMQLLVKRGKCVSGGNRAVHEHVLRIVV